VAATSSFARWFIVAGLLWRAWIWRLVLVDAPYFSRAISASGCFDQRSRSSGLFIFRIDSFVGDDHVRAHRHKVPEPKKNGNVCGKGESAQSLLKLARLLLLLTRRKRNTRAITVSRMNGPNYP